ncbi:hypothetical protein CKM354_001077400 [Cercospora kikuchii]|uniref:Sphingoid long-chain base transporter RSB1 n=1 Tax=Cercospora kikuchii TaxID=84275 RepID=A0A9P3CRN2_9PEZI|nr:uncharacterized protein CKM354_001077400 [Cercospora kikuchii]GIZ47689.1 hypothetical protein CKM354_001077400 [Cercospora kikuchii]
MAGPRNYFNSTCTAVGPDCPVEESVYGYYPSFEINASLLIAFGCLTVIQVYLALWKKTYFFGALLTLSCLGEVGGYAGRVLLHDNPFNVPGLYLSICCLDFAPSFLAAAVHATLKHITLTFGATTSILPPPMYTWIFIALDMFCLVLLATGSALSPHLGVNLGVGISGYILVLCGIILQILTLVIFAGLVLDYLYRTRRAWHNVPFAATKLLDTLKFKLFAAGVVVAYTGVLVRCIFRLVELSGLWPRGPMRSQVAFILCESCMILIATMAFTIFHPVFCFALSKNARRGKRRWRISVTKPVVEEPRGPFATSWKRDSGRECEMPHQPAELASPIRSEFSGATTLAAPCSQVNLVKKAKSETWYSEASDQAWDAETHRGPSEDRGQTSRETSRETWYSDVTLEEADVVEFSRPCYYGRAL